MNSTILNVIKQNNPKTVDEAKSILREILQSIVLAGLSKSGFFGVASFYGGTALRIFYGLNRYSEDLDFTLNAVSDSFSIDPYVVSIKETARSFGLDLSVSVKEKKIRTPIESAFAKINTYQTLFELKINDSIVRRLHKDESIKVKLEIDCNPALGFKTSVKWTDMMEFAPVVVLDASSLFAGKIHAILCRNYKNAVKGRDYYDFAFFVMNKVKPNMDYLRNKLVNTGKLEESAPFNIEILKKMVNARIDLVDFELAKKDAERFLMQIDDLAYFNKDFFHQLVERL